MKRHLICETGANNPRLATTSRRDGPVATTELSRMFGAALIARGPPEAQLIRYEGTADFAIKSIIC